jgi:F-type H+-transporting ATPase subunit gamma
LAFELGTFFLMIPLRDIRRQIQSIRKISHITRAMKTVSAIRLMKIQSQVVRQRPYALKLREVVTDLISRTATRAHPMLRSPIAECSPSSDTYLTSSGRGHDAESCPLPEGRIVCVALGSDRGLCGPFNNNLVLNIQQFLKVHSDRKVELVIGGRRLRDLLRSHKAPLGHVLPDFYEAINFEKVVRLAEGFRDRYLSGEVDELWCIYTEFKSSARQQVTAERLLPISAEALTEEPLFPPYRYEPDEFSILDSILPMYYNREWWRITLESQASEHITRMRAMDMATVNAGEMIDDLTLALNKARQETITRELSEISLAAEALRGG